ncbi:MAG: tryptophan--tRNA ligase [Candidatus Doudnabacteria bacterium]|nr:tryptophan--tRNA ligase [Candidatus Doudnabacteria bacterium]
MKERIVSGIQPTGDLHIGNYLGSLKNFVELQDKFDCYFFVADLHSLTEDFTPGQPKADQIRDLVKTFVAAGLNPDKCTIFIQSQVPQHAELTWILNTLLPMGELERMTQYKDKSGRQSANINVGLFDYPVLMSADILLYKPAFVPVGHDQLQHLELTNTLARKFNHKFGETFSEVKPYMQKPLRIMSLADPERKMSKSEPGSFINMFDSPEEIAKKLSRAVTATDAPEGEMPKGVKNLFDLLLEFGNQEVYDDFTKQYQAGTIKYSDLKQTLASQIAQYFQHMREIKQQLDTQERQIDKIIADGAVKAGKVAQSTVQEVKAKIGLI